MFNCFGWLHSFPCIAIKQKELLEHKLFSGIGYEITEKLSLQ